jgi:hypothetical protein
MEIAAYFLTVLCARPGFPAHGVQFSDESTAGFEIIASRRPVCYPDARPMP